MMKLESFNSLEFFWYGDENFLSCQPCVKYKNKWCILEAEKELKERIYERERNFNIGEKIVCNAVFCLKRGMSPILDKLVESFPACGRNTFDFRTALPGFIHWDIYQSLQKQKRLSLLKKIG